MNEHQVHSGQLEHRRSWAAVACVGLLAAAGCGAGTPTGLGASAAVPASGSANPAVQSPARTGPVDPLPSGWKPLVTVRGRPSVAIRSISTDAAAMTLIRLDAPSTRLVLHPGYQDPGGTGWPTHSAVRPDERPVLLAAFNGGFKLDAGAGGMMIGTRRAGRLGDGLASVVTYTDGTSEIGTWQRDVPAAGREVANVRQNLHLLVDGGHVAGNIDSVHTWGATIGGAFAVARSALGIDSGHNLMWVGSMSASPRALADALVAAGAVRALELDINPTWVCAFAFSSGQQSALLSGQQRPIGTYIQPWKRDFFTVDSR